MAYLQAIVAARLRFEDVLRVVVPMTEWWHDKRTQKILESYTEKSERSGTATVQLRCSTWGRSRKLSAERLRARERGTPNSRAQPRQHVGPLDRYVALASLILWAATATSQRRKKRNATISFIDRISEILEKSAPTELAKRLAYFFEEILKSPQDSYPLVWQISLNRSATPALVRSVPAVKADAARSLFRVDCSEMSWAVLDSGDSRRSRRVQRRERNQKPHQEKPGF